MLEFLMWEVKDSGPALVFGLIVALVAGFLAYMHGYDIGYAVRSTECANNRCLMGTTAHDAQDFRLCARIDEVSSMTLRDIEVLQIKGFNCIILPSTR